MLLTCQAGFEPLLGRELAGAGLPAVEQGPGWLRTERDAPGAPLAFPHLTLLAPVEVRGDSVNALAQRVAEFFLASLQGERIEAAWPSVWLGPQETVGLGRRIASVEAACGELLKKKLSRVAKLARADVPRGAGPARGLFVYFTDFGRGFVAREAWVHGQRRMADDDLAPSRSYLKVEEAYILLGREPAAGETVCDLGAAPGGDVVHDGVDGHALAQLDAADGRLHLPDGPIRQAMLELEGAARRRRDAGQDSADLLGGHGVEVRDAHSEELRPRVPVEALRRGVGVEERPIL